MVDNGASDTGSSRFGGRVSRRTVLGASGAAAAAAAVGGAWMGLSGEAAPPAPPPARAGRPNIVLIMLDDLGDGDLSSLGSRQIRTPRIDSVGEQGMTFQQMYAGAPVCTPSRAALLTGRYAQRTGLPEVLQPEDRHGLPADERTIADVLRAGGYRTGIFGKWHLGNPARRRELNPVHHGFDSFAGLPYSNDMNPLPFYVDERVVDDHVGPVEQTQLTRRYTDAAIEFMRHNRDRPFFCYLPHSSPHRPFHPPASTRGRSGAGGYGDVVEEADFQIGRVLDELDRLGLVENTLVVVTSDNGPWFQGTTGGLRGRKTTVFEGGVRIPFAARWPGHVEPGSECDQVTSFLDMMPTLAALAGVRPPRDRPLDGVDLGPVLRGQRVERPPLCLFNGWSLNAVRSGPWKLHRSSHPRPDPPEMPLLFNIPRDRGETRNVARDHPRIVRRLHRVAEDVGREIAAGRPEAERRALGG